MSSPYERSLRANQNTPRTKVHNQRYGASSRTPVDADGGDSSSAAVSSDASSATKGRTPRNGSTWASSFKDTHGLAPGGKGTPRGKSTLAAPPRPPVPRQNSAIDDADSISVAESDDVSVITEDDYGPQEGDSVQVFVRVRPINAAEAAEDDQYSCTKLYGERSVSVELKHRSEPYHFKFDCVLPEATTQQEIFDRAGKPIVDNCMGGYNSSIFAYGQTGAGKTYTMQGPLSAALQEDNQQRGLAPRVFEYLFSEIDKAQDENCHENLTFCCRCSMLEIYNEVITDLLNPSASNLQIREDIKRGCYVEDLSEHTIQNVSDAMRLMRIGAENRHVGETRLNRESSRSHSVFTCVLERQSKNQTTGITNVLFSRLNLIDLAGSERVHGGEHGGSQATGKHFKEACHINKSLTTLGRVITELVEAQRSAHARAGSVGKGAPAAARGRHVPYRDSRLTFLLQDSLGGNAKTLMIANISPSSVSGLETLSTLQFMSRAKCIRNRAQINLDARGDVGLLQREILRLNNELDNLRKGYTEPAIQENKQLREELDKMRESRGEIDLKVVNLEKENQNLKSERRRLDHKMAQIQKGASQLDSAIFTLSTKMESCEQKHIAALEKALQVAELEHELQVAELQLQLAAAQHNSQGAEELQQALEQLQQQLEAVQADADDSREAHNAANAEVAALQVQLGAEQQRNNSLADQVSNAQQQSASLTEQLEAVQRECADLTQQLTAAQQESASAVQQLEAAQHHAAELQQHLHTKEQRAEDLQEQLRTAQQGSEELLQQLGAAQQSAAELQVQLQEAQTGAASLEERLQAAQQEQAVLVQQLEAAQQETAATQKQMDEATTTAQAQLSELSDSLEASKSLAQQLQQEVQDHKDRAATLEEEGQTLRSQLEQQQDDSKELKRQLTEVQEQLAAVNRELEQAKEMATCSEAEAGKRLADALAARDVTQQELEQACSVNTGLQEQVAALEEQVMQAQQQLQQEVEARQQESDTAASSQAAADAIEQQLREQLAELQQQLATKQQDLSALSSEKQELHSKLGLKQQQCSELQQQLEAEQGRSAEGRSQVAALEDCVAELNTSVKNKAQALEAAQDQVKQLQQQLQQKEDALATAVSKQDQLSSDLAAVRDSSKGKQEELMKQVTEVHMQLSAAQQEQERLQEDLDTLRSDNGLLQTQVADARGEMDNFRGQASTKALECELLRKKLAAAESTNTSLRTDLQDSQQEVSVLRQQLQVTESAADESQQELAEELNEMKRELLDNQQLLQEAGYEKAQLQRRMEELSQRLVDKSSSLDSSKKEIQALKATIREQENSARQRDAALADQSAFAHQLQADNAALSSRLQDVQEQLADREAELRGRLNMNELQLKEQIVFNARNRQAMNEIRKVINWAQQPPTATTPPHGAQLSRPGSSASRRVQVQQFSHLDTGSIPGSPAGSSYHELLTIEQPYDAPDPADEPCRGVLPPLMLPGSQLAHQGSGGSHSGSSRHYSSHNHGHSRHHHHHHHHQHYGHDRYAEPVAVGGDAAVGLLGRAGSSGSSRRGGGIGSKGGAVGSPAGGHLPSRGGDMLPLMLQVSGDLEVETAGDEGPSSAYSGRDTAGCAPGSPAVSEAASSAAAGMGIGSSRSRAHRVGSPTRSSGSKQQLAAALAAAQHRVPPDQQHHHARQQQEVYVAEEEQDDDTVQPGMQEGCDAQDGHLMAPQQASSPVPSSPKEGQHGSISKSRGGRDVGSRRGLRAGSDAHSFSKCHKLVAGEVPPVVLSVSGEWSAGGHDSIPDMRLPAAIVGDEGSEP